jgi:hypothetical protein
MSLFLITYDLRSRRSYEGLVQKLRDWGCVRPLLSVWLGDLNGTAAAVRDELKAFMGNDDALLVVELSESAQWTAWRCFPASIEWLRERVAPE